MITLGFILAVLGYWLIPLLLPTFPPNFLEAIGGVGVILILVGLVFFVLGAAGRPIGGRRYWW